MSDEQTKLLTRFKEIYKNPTYKEMSDISNINLTRIFRLNNGFEMKMSEYLKIKKCIDDKIAQSSNVQFVFNQCIENLSVNVLKEIEKFCSRKLEIKEMLKISNTNEVVA